MYVVQPPYMNHARMGFESVRIKRKEPRRATVSGLPVRKAGFRIVSADSLPREFLNSPRKPVHTV
jgi:hypothetical protein